MQAKAVIGAAFVIAAAILFHGLAGALLPRYDWLPAGSRVVRIDRWTGVATVGGWQPTAAGVVWRPLAGRRGQFSAEDIDP